MAAVAVAEQIFGNLHTHWLTDWPLLVAAVEPQTISTLITVGMEDIPQVWLGHAVAGHILRVPAVHRVVAVLQQTCTARLRTTAPWDKVETVVTRRKRSAEVVEEAIMAEEVHMPAAAAGALAIRCTDLTTWERGLEMGKLISNISTIQRPNQHFHPPTCLPSSPAPSQRRHRPQIRPHRRLGIHPWHQARHHHFHPVHLPAPLLHLRRRDRQLLNPVRVLR